MVEVRTVHTAFLTERERDAIRALLDEAFGGDFSEDDHEHGLGGMHVLVSEDEGLVGHGSVVMRRLLHRGRALRTGYVEAVAVRPDRRRRGHATRVMDGLEGVIAAAYELGALSATDDAVALYARRGWRLWTGTSSVVAPGGIRPTADDDGSIYVLPVAASLDPALDLACDWRSGDVW